MTYQPINIPIEGDGTTFALSGNGYFRGVRLASIPRRAAAFLIDCAVLGAAFVVMLLIGWGLDAIGLDTVAGLLTLAVMFAVWFLNQVLMVAIVGQSVGKAALGLYVAQPLVDPMDVDAHFYGIPSIWTMIWRNIVHGLDLVFLVGVASIFISNRRECLADRACNTLVFHPRDPAQLKLQRDISGAKDR